ncbi:uncharacterized protein VTP21DRAFT_6454 [Calcarisporiella thermophila]|uniref:uncharacterized protein n=1 Tax=Calcarisporiella thermophila TaxID=911321 RepID=UPI00374419F2
MFRILSSLALVLFIYVGLTPVLVAGNGMMTNTPPRLVEGDAERGFPVATGANNRPPCGGLQRGETKGQFKEGGKLPLNWAIKTPRGGPCLFELSTNGQDSNFRPILKVNKCGDKAGDDNTQINLPRGLTCDQCTVRFRWVSQRPRLNFVNCADISITGRGPGEQLPGRGGFNGFGGGRGGQQFRGNRVGRRVAPRSETNTTVHVLPRELLPIDEEFEQLWHEALVANERID